MGKAALFLVAAFSMAGARLLYTSQEADVKSAANQGDYEAEVIAREIARSAYNAAIADVHRYGTDIDLALREFGPSATNCVGGKKVCFRRSGEMLGGTYVVEASVDGGNGIDVYTKGLFSYDAGGREVVGEHEINESQSVGVLKVGDAGRLKIQFVDSQAGYCSAIFLKRTIPGLPDAEQPLPEMVYGPGRRRDGESNVGYETVLASGTQMNFAIGVSPSCKAPARYPDLVWDKSKERNSGNLIGPDLAAALKAYDFRESDWDWMHWALDGSALRDGDPKEAPWAMVETDPNNDQRWRISFEDIHKWNLAEGHKDYHNPNESLWATKHYGYDWSGSFRNKGSDGQGNGWTDTEAYVITPKRAGYPGCGYKVELDRHRSDSYHDLRDTGSPADFSDQVIFVEIVDPKVPASPVGCPPEA